MTEFDLINFFKRYGLNYDNLKFNSQRKLLTSSLKNMEKILNYLVIDKKINPKYIEKAPSILSSNFSLIKDNYDFLEKQNDIYMSNVNKCLHVLSCEFKDTYDYIIKNYGASSINKATYILSIPKERLLSVEKAFNHVLDKESLLSAAASNLDLDDLTKIINICFNEKVKITPSVFLQVPSEVRDIINLCKAKNINITGSVFHKTATDIEELLLICKNNEVSLSNSMFSVPNDKIKSIIDVCHQENIEVSGLVFSSSPQDILNISTYCKENKIKLKNSFFHTDFENFKSIVTFCKKEGYPLIESMFLRRQSEV